MFRVISSESFSTDSDVFYVERSSVKHRPLNNNTPLVLNFTQLSRALESEVITISSVAFPETHIVRADSDSNNPTIPFGYGKQQPNFRPGLKDLTCLSTFST